MAFGQTTYINKPMGLMPGSGSSIDLVPPSMSLPIDSPMAFNGNGYSNLDVTLFPGPAASPAGFRYNSLRLAPNGFLYGFPIGTMGSVLKINPQTGSFSQFGSIGTLSHNGTVLASNGRLYSVPNGATTIWELNPETDSLTSFGTVPAGSNKYSGGILAPNGLIYCAPGTATNILVINPNNLTISTVSISSITTSTVAKYASGILAPNGKIYFFPNARDSILVVEPMNDNRIYEIGPISSLLGLSFSGSSGGILGLNNKIYIFGFNAPIIIELDPQNDSLRSFAYRGFNGLNRPLYRSRDSFLPATLFTVLGTNGKSYGGQSSYTGTDTRESLPTEYDIENMITSKLYDSTRSIPVISNDGSTLYPGGTIDRQGNIWLVGQATPTLMRISGFPPATPDMYTIPPLSQLQFSIYNKFLNRGR